MSAVRRALTVVAAAGVALQGFPATPSHAASPGAQTISFAHPHASWSNAMPLNGYLPPAGCGGISCDDVALVLDRGSDDTAVLHLQLTVTAPSRAVIEYSAPGCPSNPGDCELQQDPAALTIPYVPSGRSTVRVLCQPCAQGVYTVEARLAHGTPPRLPGPGRNLGWRTRVLPVVDDGIGPHSDLSFGEPGISINRGGHVIVNTMGMTAWISEDDGQTFTHSMHPDATPCRHLVYDADAQVSADGVYYAVNLCATGSTNLVYASTDGGRTWNGSRDGLPGSAGSLADRPWITTDPANPATVYVSAVLNEAASGGQMVLIRRSTDGGQTFGAPEEMHLTDSRATQTAWNGILLSRPLVDPTDSRTISAIYLSNARVTSGSATTTPDDDVTQIYLARSHDSGATWSSALAYDAGQTAGRDDTIAHTFAPAAVDSAGNIYVAFSLRRGGRTQTHVMLGVIPRGSTSMRAPVQVDRGGLGANVFPWLAAGDPGMVDLSWYGSTASDNNDVHAAWSEMFAQSLNALSGHPTFVQSRVSDAVPIHAADICTVGAACAANGGNRWLEDFQSMDVDPCGMAQLVWADDHTMVGSTMYTRQTAGSSVRPSACGRDSQIAGAARDHGGLRQKGGIRAALRECLAAAADRSLASMRSPSEPRSAPSPA